MLWNIFLVFVFNALENPKCSVITLNQWWDDNLFYQTQINSLVSLIYCILTSRVSVHTHPKNKQTKQHSVCTAVPSVAPYSLTDTDTNWSRLRLGLCSWAVAAAFLAHIQCQYVSYWTCLGHTGSACSSDAATTNEHSTAAGCTHPEMSFFLKIWDTVVSFFLDK